MVERQIFSHVLPPRRIFLIKNVISLELKPEEVIYSKNIAKDISIVKDFFNRIFLTVNISDDLEASSY